jgi:hypothetical protein
MNKASYALKLPLSIKNAAQRLAKEDGVSLNQWISVAVAQKIGAVESAADFLKRKAGHAKAIEMLAFLDRAGNEPPLPTDQLPPALAAKRRGSSARGHKPKT